MNVSAFATGTQSATVTTEHFLSNVNVAGRFGGVIDVSAMVDGDILELRAYQMVLTSGTARVVQLITLYGAQPADALIVEWGKDLYNELTDANSLRYSLKQTFGTSRSFPWKITKGNLSPADVWDRLTSALSVANSIGKLLVDNVNATISSRSTLTAANVWDALTSGLSTANSIGKLLVDNINATISSRSSHTAADVWAAGTRTLTAISDSSGITTLLARLSAARALLLDNLDAAISTRLASSSYTSPPSVASIADGVWDEEIVLGHDTADSAGEQLNDASAGGGGGGGGATAAQIWDYLLTSIATSGSIGKLIKDNLNATISSRSSHTAADVWAAGTRTLTSFGTLAQDIWDKATSSLTTIGSIGAMVVGMNSILVSSVNPGITTLLSNATTLLSRIASALTITGGKVDVNDKTGFSLAAGQLVVKKGVALSAFEFLLRSSADHLSPITAMTVTAERSIDGGAFAACSNAVTEVGSGIYKINLSTTDLNGNVITLKFSATGADARYITILTQT